MNCHKCGSEEITYYKQRRVDGVWVVVARCDHGHSPIKGKPFYSVSQFDISKLPRLFDTEEPRQPELIPHREEIERPETLVEYVEQMRNRNNLFPSVRKHS